MHGSNTHTTANCRAYAEKTPRGKVELLKLKMACWSCSKGGHRSIDCTQRKNCAVDSACDKYHDESFHQAHVDAITFHAATVMEKSKVSRSDSCLLQLMRVNSGTSPSIGLNVLWDGGATTSLMIGFENAGFHPVREQSRNHLLGQVDG